MKGANRSTRIEELAVDLRVPVELVRLYRNANGAHYDYYSPASYDLQVAECEGNHRFSDKWDGVRKLEDHLGLTDVDEIESGEEDEEELDRGDDDDLSDFSDSD